MSPFKWLRDPLSHLRLIQHHAGTISFMPNSALNHAARRATGCALDGLDLRSLRMLISGSEPILHESQEEFLTLFAGCGFRESAMSSGYGMAENTLAITVSEKHRRAPVDWVWAKTMQNLKIALPAPARTKGAKPNVSSGVPMKGMEIAVVGEEGLRLDERSIGEITVKSISLFSGYHANSMGMVEVVKDGWYHTGDLGYIADGHLYVCGRKKDLIIVGGHNTIQLTWSASPQACPASVATERLRWESLTTRWVPREDRHDLRHG